MTCDECGIPFGDFDKFVPVYQTSMGMNEAIRVVGWVHMWHLMNPEPAP